MSQKKKIYSRFGQVGDLTIMPKPQASAWGNNNRKQKASERRFMVEIIISVILFIVIFLFLWLGCPQYLLYQEQYQLFLFTGDYFMNAISVPGGLADYLSEFVVQFFYVPLYGSIAAALTLTLSQVFLGLACRKCDMADAAYALSALPSMLFLGAMGDENMLMSFAVAMMLTTLFLYLLSLLKVTSLLTDTVSLAMGFAVLYWLAGPLAMVFVVAGGIIRRRPVSMIISLGVAFGIIWCLQLIWLEQYPLVRLLKGINYYRIPEIYPVHLYVITGSLLLAPLATLAKGGVKAARAVSFASFAVVVLVGIIYIRSSFNEDKSRVLAYDSFVRQGRWTDIIEKAKEENPSDQFSLQALNLALGMTGQLSETMFQFPQRGIAGLVGKDRLDNTTQLITAEALYRLGLANIAFSTTFDLQEAIMNDRKSGRFMKRMAECMLINGNYAVAEKYINMLKHSLYYSDWARQAETLLHDDNAVESHPIYGPLRRNGFSNEAFYDYSQVDKIFAMLAADGKGSNQLALQYFCAAAMLNGNLPLLANSYGYLAQQYGQVRIPRHVEEALALYWTMSHNSFEGIPFPISQEVRRQTAELARTAMQNQNNPGAWRSVAPGSFGVYFLGIMRNHAQSAKTQDYYHTHE